MRNLDKDIAENGSKISKPSGLEFHLMMIIISLVVQFVGGSRRDRRLLISPQVIVGVEPIRVWI